MQSNLSSAGVATKKSAKSKPGSSPSRVSVQDVAFASKALGREAKYRVVLPVGYAETAHRYPVLYLMHGVFGGSENWETLTDLTRYAAGTDLIIVMPDAGNSWYVNSATDATEQYEDLIGQELIPHVDEHWRTLRSSHRRAIAGLSMGGYGAVKFALKNLNMFSVAASISGAFDGPLDLDTRREDLCHDLRKAFGAPDSDTRRENDVFELLTRADAKTLPYFYLDCGTTDEFCDVNRRLATMLCARGARYEYHEVPGAHSWQYWDQRIAIVLPLIDKMLRAG